MESKSQAISIKMKTSKAKPPVIYGDDLPITPHQIKEIMRNCSYNDDIKCEWVQWVTEDVNRTSLKSITQSQAVKIMRQQTGDERPQVKDKFEVFDKDNPKHRVILSLLYQANWTTFVNVKEVPDMERFANWLQTKAPIQKPLKEQSPEELEKTIKAFKGVIKSIYK